MPLYMDFHELPDGVTAAHLAEMHQADLKIEHKHQCRGLTYWCDEKRQTAFCLIEAPNKRAIVELHQEAHGAVPQRIIEVNENVVESFLGRIQDPQPSKNTKFPIINDPAFRTLMVVKINTIALRKKGADRLKSAIKNYRSAIKQITDKHLGSIVRERSNSYLMAFDSVSNAITSALSIHDVYKPTLTPDLQFQIGLSAGVPVNHKAQIFEDTIERAKQLSYISNGKVVISTELKDLYDSDNHQAPLKQNPKLLSLNKVQERFIMTLMDYTEKVWMNAETSVSSFQKNLGYSKSKLYRTMTSLLGQSPNTFLKTYRLSKALELLEKHHLNISEIAYQTGFSSPGYFSNCFQETYGILPSTYRNSVSQ